MDDKQKRALKAQFPEIAAEIDVISASTADPIEMEQALYVALGNATDALGQPKYTTEQIDEITKNLGSTSFVGGYGKFGETAVGDLEGTETAMGTGVTVPQTIPDPKMGFTEALQSALRPQAYIMPGDEPGTTIRGSFEEAYDLTPELDQVLPQLMQQSFDLPDEEVQIYVDSFKDLYGKYRREGKTQEDAKNAVIDTLSSMADVGTLGEGDPKDRDPTLLDAFSMRTTDVGGVLPDYNADQQRFLRNIRDRKVELYIQQELANDKQIAQSRGSTDTRITVPHYRIQFDDGSTALIPVEVYNYFNEKKQLAGNIYSKRMGSQMGFLDDKLREHFAGEIDTFAKALPRTEVERKIDGEELEALYRVQGYQKHGGDEWWLDPVNKSLVMANPDAYSNLSGNVFTPSKGTLGGTVDQPLSWVLKLVMGVPSALTYGTLEYGVYPVLDSVFDTDIAGETRKQRKLKQPWYTDYPVLGAIAEDKGLTGYVGDALDAYGVTGATRRNIDLALIGTDMFLNPDVAAAVGIAKGLMSPYQVAKINKARKTLGEATSASDFAKVVASNTVKPILDDLNVVSLTAKKVAPDAVKKLQNYNPGDGRVLLQADVENSLLARRVATETDTPMRTLIDAGLDETGYGKALKKMLDEQDVDQITAVKQLDEIYTKNKGLGEYLEYNRVLKEANQIGFEGAIKAAKDRGAVADLKFLEDVQKRYRDPDAVRSVLDTIYARKIVYENTPKVKGIDEIQFVSSDAAINKRAYPEFLSRVKQDSLSKALSNAVNANTRMIQEVQPAQVARGKYGSDFDDATVAFGKMDNAFILDDLDAREISYQIEGLSLPQETYLRIKDTLNENKLFMNDYNLLRDKINTRVATEMREGATIQDLSALSPTQQRRLQEGIGTAYRSGSPIMDAVNDLREGMGKLLNSNKPNRILKALNEVTYAPVGTLAVKQREMIAKIQRKASGLDTQLRQDVKALTSTSSTKREIYGAPKNIDTNQAVGYLIIGPRQVEDLAVLKQTQELENNLAWMFDQLVFKEGKLPILTYFDRNFQFKQVINNNIYSAEGKEAYKAYLADVAQKMMDDKRNFWTIFGEAVEEWTRKIKNDRIEIMDPEDPTRVAKTVSYTKTTYDMNPADIRQLSAKDATDQIEKLSAGTYFYAEMRRIHDSMMVEFINGQLKPTDAVTLFRGQDVQQDTFDNLMRTGIREVAIADYDNEALMQMLREYADIELRYQKAKEAVGADEFANFEKTISDEVKRIVDDVKFDEKFEKKYEQMQVKEQTAPEVDDAMQTLKVQYDLDIQALRETKAKKIEAEFAPIRKEYEDRIAAAKEKKEESTIARINREAEERIAKDTQPIEDKRIEDLKKPTKKLKQVKKTLEKETKDKLGSLGGKGYNRAQINQKQKEISANYKAQKKKAVDEYKAEVKRINDDAKAKKEAIEEKYNKQADKLKEEYRSLPKEQREPSKVKKLRNELEAKRREITNRYEKERKERAKELLELRKELEKAEKAGVAEANELARRRIREKYDERLEQIQDEFLTVKQKGLIAQLEYLDRYMNLDDTPFGDVYKILTTESDPDLVRDIAYKINEYSTMILKNNNMLNRVPWNVEDLEFALTDMFKNNPEWGKAIFGLEQFKAFEAQFSRHGLSRFSKNIQQFLLDQVPGVKSVGVPAINVVGKMLAMSQQLFYVGVLGLALRSHGVNIASGDLLTYATVGRRTLSAPFSMNPKEGFDTMKQASKTVWYGSSQHDPRAFEIAVTTPTGQKYTYRDIYSAIIDAGVRTQFNFVDNVLAEGKVITFLKANNKAREGFSTRFMARMENIFNEGTDLASEILVKEDMMFRSGAMIGALKEGVEFNEAVQIARRSLFDYNDLTPVEKALSSYAFVFYNFTRQSFVDFILGVQNPQTLKRYLNSIKFSRSTQQLMMALNDGKQFPYRAFFPGYSAIRTITDYKKTSEEKTYDFFNMMPGVPAVETMGMITDVVNLYGLTRQDTAVGRVGMRFLDPKLKYMFGLDAKYLRKQMPSELINVLKLVSSDQADLQAKIEFLVGGKIDPRIATEEDYGTKGIDSDDYFIYDLNEDQYNRLRAVLFVMQQSGIQRITYDWSRTFMPEGTVMQEASPMERALFSTGMITPQRMKKPEIQESEMLQKVLREGKRRAEQIENREKNKLRP